jgi:hypothetical protein
LQKYFCPEKLTGIDSWPIHANYFEKDVWKSEIPAYIFAPVL